MKGLINLFLFALAVGGTMVAAEYGYAGAVGITTAIVVGLCGAYFTVDGILTEG